MTQQTKPENYALEIADNSYNWYLIRSIRTRRSHRLAEIVLLFLSASIPASVVIIPEWPWIPAVTGVGIVMLSGLKSIFNWHENYLRFSRARESIEAERRLFKMSLPPYDNPISKEGELVQAITRIEQEEMSSWVAVRTQGNLHSTPISSSSAPVE
ncbi:DUF4231 domain-containing protein [Actinokineospora pegani]|uniref:DUF4231 domain-containing protein n=1 Tax=Actinokineospora pegani TaxID=2654637 RepID=UPI0018D4D71E